VNKALSYIDDVLAGRVVASKLVRLTIERHQRDLANGHERGLTFNPKKAQHIITFIQTFCHHSVGQWAGQKLKLEPWQQALLWILFGWQFTDTGYRRFKFAYIELGRGNGKSMIASCVALYELLGSGEPGAECFSIATRKEQAKIVFDEACRIIKQSPVLKKRVKNYRDSLFIPDTASKFQPLASDEDSLDGLRPQCIIADELAAWSTSGRKLWDVLVSALGKRRSPLFFAITTAGSDRNSVCWQQRSYVANVLNGIFEDDRWYGWIAGLDEGDDYEDPETWVKANPNLDVSVSRSDLADAVRKAKNDPASLNGVLRLRLGVWTTNSTQWMPMDKWDACNGEVDREALKGRPCYSGLDLSTSIDISAFVMLFPPHGSDTKWRVLCEFFLPGDNLPARVKRDRVPYDVWNRQGLFNLTEGTVIDYDVIRNRIKAFGKLYNIREIAFDRWGAQQICTQLTGDGFQMVEFGQGFASMGAPTKRLMELVLSGELAHGGNPVLRWMASNTMVEIDPAGNIKPSKSKSREKIDGIVSLCMAIARGNAATATIRPNIRLL
jgi:phage terminase large subunit-like protein